MNEEKMLMSEILNLNGLIENMKETQDTFWSDALKLITEIEANKDDEKIWLSKVENLKKSIQDTKKMEDVFFIETVELLSEIENDIERLFE